MASLRLLVVALAGWVPTAGAGELERLIASALATHPAVQVQSALVRSAQAVASGARWQYYPTPSVTIDASRTSASDTAFQGDDRVTTLRIQQPIWSGGRLAAGVDKAEANILVNQASFDEARQQLALRVLQAYGEWLSAHLRVQATDRSLAVHERLLAQVKRRIAQGASGASDSVLAETRLQSVLAEQAAAQAQRDIAIGRLGQLVGHEVDATALGASFALPRPFERSLEATLASALSIHPNLQRSWALSEVRRVEVSERRAAAAPEVFLRFERQHGNATVAQADPVNRVFIGLSSNFGAGLSSLANIDAAKAQHQAALAEVAVQTLAVREQILADHRLVTSSEQRLAAIEASMAAAKGVSESFDRQFLAGRKSWIDVMNAAREIAQLEVQLAEVRSLQLVGSWRLAIVSRGLDAASGSPR